MAYYWAIFLTANYSTTGATKFANAEACEQACQAAINGVQPLVDVPDSDQQTLYLASPYPDLAGAEGSGAAPSDGRGYAFPVFDDDSYPNEDSPKDGSGNPIPWPCSKDAYNTWLAAHPGAGPALVDSLPDQPVGSPCYPGPWGTAPLP